MSKVDKNENKKVNLNNTSVIIRTHNEERWIGHTIQSVIDYFYKPEIIIVDNKSKDETINIIKHFQEDPELNNKHNKQYTKIKIIEINNYTPGKAINLGVNRCTNNYILIISSHCVLTKMNMEKHKNDLEKHACIFGNQIPVWEGKKIQKRYIWSHFPKKEVVNMYSEMEKRYFMHNALSLYKKSTLINNPFDEYLIGKEDRYWANKIIDNNLSILYDPEMEVLHHYTSNGSTWKGIG
jgi:glycosyltransferase involved in cell wall biosynthesis